MTGADGCALQVEIKLAEADIYVAVIDERWVSCNTACMLDPSVCGRRSGLHQCAA